MPVLRLEKSITFAGLLKIAGIAQLVEHDLAKVGVASSSLVSRSETRKPVEIPAFFMDIVVSNQVAYILSTPKDD